MKVETPYLVVDLDDSLLQTDTLFELLIKSLRKRPFGVFRLAFILFFQGVSRLKRALSLDITLDPGTLPYRQSVLDLCQQYRVKEPKHRLVLASAADEQIVKGVADHLKLFDFALGSQPGHNLKSKAKLAAIKHLTQAEGFAYVGDSRADLPIWAESQHAILINPASGVLSKVKRLAIPHDIVRDRPSPFPLILKQIRVHQWVKNALIFVPLIAAHQLRDLGSALDACIAFLAFSALASSVYVLNDLIDVSSDRRHPSKCKRPFASGALSLKWGFILLPLLLLIFSAFSSLLPWNFFFVGLTYFGLNLLYTFKLKEQMILDVILLGAFYTLRIMAGGYATHTFVSAWLLSFSTFFFFGLAMVKRYTELEKLQKKAANPFGRGYRQEDALPVFVLGTSSSLLALLVLTLYFTSAEVSILYTHASRLWLILPLLLYWTGRIWILAHRGAVDDDPVVFAIKDRSSWVMATLFLMVLWVSL